MLFSHVLALVGTLATVVIAIPTRFTTDSDLTTRRDDQCNDCILHYKDCYAACKKSGGHDETCQASCSEATCVNDPIATLCKQSKYPRRDSVNAGAEHEVVNFVEIKHEVEAETEVGTADKLDSRNDGAVKVTTRCDSCAATFQLYISKGDCHTAMDKMCDSYCKDECDYSCSCKVYYNPDWMPSCSTLAGRACVPH